MSAIEESQDNGGGWIEWGGGECPVDGSLLVDVRLYDDISRSSGTALAGQLDWSADLGQCTPIIAYRIAGAAS